MHSRQGKELHPALRASKQGPRESAPHPAWFQLLQPLISQSGRMEDSCRHSCAPALMQACKVCKKPHPARLQKGVSCGKRLPPVPAPFLPPTPQHVPATSFPLRAAIFTPGTARPGSAPSPFRRGEAKRELATASPRGQKEAEEEQRPLAKQGRSAAGS